MAENRSNWVEYRCADCGASFGGGPPNAQIGHECPIRVLRERVDRLELKLLRLESATLGDTDT